MPWLIRSAPTHKFEQEEDLEILFSPLILSIFTSSLPTRTMSRGESEICLKKEICGNISYRISPMTHRISSDRTGRQRKRGKREKKEKKEKREEEKKAIAAVK